jgi:hypothetical protein
MTEHPAPAGSIVITPAELYAEVRALTIEVRDLVGRDKTDHEAIADLKARVRSLEQKIWIASGGAAALGGLAGTLLPSLMSR